MHYPGVTKNYEAQIKEMNYFDCSNSYKENKVKYTHG